MRSQRKQFEHFEASERGVGIYGCVAAQIGWAIGERLQVVLGGERAGEMGGEDGRVDVEDVARGGR